MENIVQQVGNELERGYLAAIRELAVYEYASILVHVTREDLVELFGNKEPNAETVNHLIMYLELRGHKVHRYDGGLLLQRHFLRWIPWKRPNDKEALKGL